MIGRNPASERDLVAEQANEDRIGAASDEWTAGTGGPFALFDASATARDGTWNRVSPA